MHRSTIENCGNLKVVLIFPSLLRTWKAERSISADWCIFLPFTQRVTHTCSCLVLVYSGVSLSPPYGYGRPMAARYDDTSARAALRLFNALYKFQFIYNRSRSDWSVVICSTIQLQHWITRLLTNKTIWTPVFTIFNFTTIKWKFKCWSNRFVSLTVNGFKRFLLFCFCVSCGRFARHYSVLFCEVKLDNLLRFRRSRDHVRVEQVVIVAALTWGWNVNRAWFWGLCPFSLSVRPVYYLCNLTQHHSKTTPPIHSFQKQTHSRYF